MRLKSGFANIASYFGTGLRQRIPASIAALPTFTSRRGEVALFGLKYFSELRSKFKGVLWRVEISERGYSGASEEMAFDGGTPLRITWEKRGDESYVPVKASEATIDILCRENFRYFRSSPPTRGNSASASTAIGNSIGVASSRPTSIPRTSPHRPTGSRSRPWRGSTCC